jgi:C4-dicarboxylate-specific signal transduction histidine kinase
MHLPANARQVLQRYGLAVVLASLALSLDGILPFPEGVGVYELPIVAVIMAAWYGGRGPGLVASLICVPVVFYWFVPPVRSFEISADHVLPFSMFFVLCVFLTEFGGGRRRAARALAKAQADLAHVSRLTTLGELSASIVHEVSQPLGAMIARADAGARWLAAEPPDMAEARAALDNIAADGKHAREVIARIRALTKRQAPREETVNINEQVLAVLAMMEHDLRSREIVLRTELDRTLPLVTGDRVQLQQVLLNLFLNALEAMSSVHDRPRELTIVSAHDGANAVRVEVRDSGPGLGEQAAERVFEAFYTTKAEGVGIGLAISRSIIKAHGGRLWADANEPRGAVFRLSLPAAERS